MTTSRRIGIALLGLAATALGAEPGRPLLTLWGCSIPCETDEIPPKALGTVQLGWCGISVETTAMIDAISPLCKARYHNDKAVARRISASLGMGADCSSSGNECGAEGPSPIAFSCLAHCPNEPQLVSFSACAMTSVDAWDAGARATCAGATRPSGDILAPSDDCTHNGETPCKP